MKKYILLFSVVAVICGFSQTSAYLFGLKSFDNTVDNILQIEEKYKVHTPIVAFIFDPRGPRVTERITEMATRMGNDRVFHITISPDGSAEDVINGTFDDEYRQAFKLFKQYDMKVLFRTMHEMNGGRYDRGSDPESFKKAWIHVWNIAREEGLDNHNILFVMSVNHRDAPTKEDPSKKAKLIFCTPKVKANKNCHTFEDYYPGDEYVDLMGVTFYNWGQAIANRKRLNPKQIMYDKERNTLGRLKKIGKPIFIDEVATTSVKYSEKYEKKKSLYVYNNVWKYKNTWLSQLRKFLQEETSIVGAIYFNIDYTNGLTSDIIGEADWAMINVDKDKIYNGAYDLFKYSQTNSENNPLLDLFGRRVVQRDGKIEYIAMKQEKKVRELLTMIDKKTDTDEEALLLIKEMEKQLTTQTTGSQLEFMQSVFSQTKKFFQDQEFVF